MTSERLHVAVGLLSVSLIAFQLVLMQILSLVQWYHFAYMVISVALLGFGASGTAIALAGDRILRRADSLLPILMILSGGTMAAAIAVAQLPGGGFDSYLLFVDPSQKWLLLFAYGVLFVPFLLGALPLGIIFVRMHETIGTLYFANLVGSGVGGILAILLSYFYFPDQLPGMVALLPVLAGVIVVKKANVWKTSMFALTVTIVCIILAAVPPRLKVSQYKVISRTMNLPDATITLERPSPFGLVQVVSSPALRYGPGLSLTYRQEVPVRAVVFNNGDWFGAVPVWNRSDTTHMLDYTTLSLPFVLGPRREVLVLHARTGMEVTHALTRGAHSVVAVEPHKPVAELLASSLSATVDSLLQYPSVRWLTVEPRTFLASDTASYDLIVLPIVDAFGGTAGLYALQEQYSLTKDAMRGMWNRLNPGGVICLSSWMDYPVRNPLKLLATICEVLEHEGVNDPANHIAAVRSWGTITFSVKRTRLTEEETGSVRAFCHAMLFDPALLPGISPEERAHFNAMQDDKFFSYLDEILTLQRDRLYEEYGFQLRPATDARPYFSQFIRWKSVPHLRTLFGDQAFPFLEMGYVLVFGTLLQIAVAAAILIGLPLAFGRRERRGGMWTVAYFGGIGIGYMFVEIIFIQRFVLYFGQPVFAAAAAIGGMLIASGIGSFVSSRLANSKETLMKVSAIIAVTVILHSILGDRLLQSTIGNPLYVKFAFGFLLIGSIGFVMGMPFPLGLRFCAMRHSIELPLAWGVNGCASVLSTALATIIAVEAGFEVVLGIAAGAYALVFLGTLVAK